MFSGSFCQCGLQVQIAPVSVEEGASVGREGGSGLAGCCLCWDAYWHVSSIGGFTMLVSQGPGWSTQGPGCAAHTEGRNSLPALQLRCLPCGAEDAGRVSALGPRHRPSI